MKVIWVSPECPYPANTGGRIGIMKRLEYFSKDNETLIPQHYNLTLFISS